MSESIEMNEAEGAQDLPSMDPESFVESALAFPCFADAASSDETSEALFDVIINAYRDDNLTEEQDQVVELLFHLNNGATPFNLKRALEIWTPEDLDAFWYSIAPEEDGEPATDS